MSLVRDENWMKQNNWKFIKFLIHHRHPMTPEQLKQKPFEEIFKKFSWQPNKEPLKVSLVHFLLD